MFILWRQVLVKWGTQFATEADAHAECIADSERQYYTPEQIRQHGDHEPYVIFEAESFDALGNNSYIRPVAIYVRGERWDCVKTQ